MTPEEYQDSMEFPMENLAVELFGFKDHRMVGSTDAQIIEYVTEKIVILKKMLLAAGVSEAMIEAVMS